MTSNCSDLFTEDTLILIGSSARCIVGKNNITIYVGSNSKFSSPLNETLLQINPSAFTTPF